MSGSIQPEDALEACSEVLYQAMVSGVRKAVFRIESRLIRQELIALLKEQDFVCEELPPEYINNGAWYPFTVFVKESYGQ